MYATSLQTLYTHYFGDEMAFWRRFTALYSLMYATTHNNNNCISFCAEEREYLQLTLQTWLRYLESVDLNVCEGISDKTQTLLK